MLTYAVLAFAVAARQEAQPIRGADLISKMMARYASAKSLEGTITLTQSAQGVSVVTTTTLAYEKPSKILIAQKQGGSDPKDSLLVSDGFKFAFSTPQQVLNPNAYMGELVKPDERPAQTVGQLYTIIASSLPDRSPVLDMLIARKEDLTYCSSQFNYFSYAGKTLLGDRNLHTIKGKWKENGLQMSPVGDFELYLSDEGDLVRYVLRQKYATPGAIRGQASGDTIEVVNTWDASVVVNGTIKPEKFALKTH